MTTHTAPASAGIPTDPDGVTGQLATWLAGLRPDDAPSMVRQRAAHLLLDGVACALVGAQLPWSRLAVDAVASFEGAGGSALIGWGRTLPAPAACLLNGTFIQGFELDDYHPAAPLHSMSLVLPSALATTETLGRPVAGHDFLTALIAGFEVGPRVGLALRGGEMLSRGWHSGAVFGTLAAAATAGHLRRLDAAQFEDALGLAATQSGGLMAAQYEAMSKRMHHGFAARAGFTAAGLAASGYTGIKRVFERPYGGFLATFGEGHDPVPEAVVEGLGSTWETEAIAVKAYAAMAATHAPIDCMLQLRDSLDPGEVDRVELWVSHAAYHHGWWEIDEPLETIGAQMNIGYAVAVALLDGQVLAQQFTRERIASDDVGRLLSRVQVHHEPEYDSGPSDRFRCRLVVTMKDGREFTAEVSGPRGGQDRPLTNADVEAKARALLAEVLPPAEVDRTVDLTLGIEELASIEDLAGLLSREVGGLDVAL